MRRIRQRLTFANVVSVIALFVALGGTAAAAIVVSSNSQVAPNTISGHRPPSGKHANVISGSVNGQDVADHSLGAADLAPSAMTRGRASGGSCDPNDTHFRDCGFVTLNLTKSSRVLIVVTSWWYGDGPGNFTDGVCRIGVDGTPFGPNVFPGESLHTTGAGGQDESLALTNVTGPLPAGSHTFGLACEEEDGNIHFRNTTVSAVALGSD
ncbi:MAG TPA: hypothetical protein VH391_11245 [Solirubrobacterales bacterium]|jgi:hypothetical protein